MEAFGVPAVLKSPAALWARETRAIPDGGCATIATIPCAQVKSSKVKSAPGTVWTDGKTLNPGR